MKGDTRCIDGRLMRHDPQHDDPELETDRGACPECDGKGCRDTDAERALIKKAEIAIQRILLQLNENLLPGLQIDGISVDTRMFANLSVDISTETRAP